MESECLVSDNADIVISFKIFNFTKVVAIISRKPFLVIILVF
jgi:hypothetical protein